MFEGALETPQRSMLISRRYLNTPEYLKLVTIWLKFAEFKCFDTHQLKFSHNLTQIYDLYQILMYYGMLPLTLGMKVGDISGSRICTNIC